MSKVLDSVKGWKFHGIAFGYIALILLDKFGGVHIDGFVVGDDWINQLFEVGGLSAIRSTIKSITGV